MRARLFGLGVLTLGGVYLFLALGLSLHTLNGPGPGVFPLVVGAGLMLTGAMAAWHPDAPVEAEAPAGALGAPLVVFASLVVFCLIFQRLGYALSGVFVMTAVLRAFKAPWRLALAISVASVVATYLVFVSLLGLPLPHGAWLP